VGTARDARVRPGGPGWMQVQRRGARPCGRAVPHVHRPARPRRRTHELLRVSAHPKGGSTNGDHAHRYRVRLCRSAAFVRLLGHSFGLRYGGGWGGLDRAASPGGAGPLLGFQRVPEPKVVKNRVHLDLRPAGTEMLDAVVARLVDLGGRVVRPVAEEPGNAHVIMQDPEGNEFCVVEA
jgi:hypothetical protein